jgi:hypothetical protein
MRLGPAAQNGPVGADERQGQVNGGARSGTRANSRSVIKADRRRDQSGLPDVGSLIGERQKVGGQAALRSGCVCS